MNDNTIECSNNKLNQGSLLEKYFNESIDKEIITLKYFSNKLP